MTHRFSCMGCEMQIVGAPEHRARAAEALLRELDARLSRFRPDSELCALNGDPRAEVPVSALLRAAVSAGLQAAATTGGLVDPTLLGALERAGYDSTREGTSPAPLQEALAAAPARRPARPAPAADWRAFAIGEGVIRRPPGLRFDTGGCGKGFSADLVARGLGDLEQFAVDCGGDLMIGGTAGKPFAVDVIHPLTREVAHTLRVTRGGVATSGLDVRIWRRPGGGFAHHLLDPATAEPAWTGLIGATALAPTALEAETLAKAALLSGPAGARRLLARHGGVIVHDDGDVEPLGAARPRPVVRIPLGAVAV
jgi:FAD:protein FMN transferase